MNWQSLRNLRASYVASEGYLEDYWTPSLLEDYHKSLGQRIFWKWESVLGLLRLSDLVDDDNNYSLLDMACGTGVASQSVLESFPDSKPRDLYLWDRSSKAQSFAKKKSSEFLAAGNIHCSLPKQVDLGLVSHVLTEMNEGQLQSFLNVLSSCESFIWVDAGTSFVSERLIKVRDYFLERSYHVHAPCTHQEACGMTSAGNEHNWCHFFADVPGEVHQSAYWREFAKELKVDLRSLPLSFLVMSRKDALTQQESISRLIGRVREYKGYCKALTCDGAGVEERQIQKRDDKRLFKNLCKVGFCASLSN